MYFFEFLCPSPLVKSTFLHLSAFISRVVALCVPLMGMGPDINWARLPPRVPSASCGTQASDTIGSIGCLIPCWALTQPIARSLWPECVYGRVGGRECYSSLFRPMHIYPSRALASHLSISGLFAVQVTNLGETKRGMRSEASPMQILTQTTLKKPCHSVTQLLE